MLLPLLLLVTACSSVGHVTEPLCTEGDRPIRLRAHIIAQLDDAEVNAILVHNEVSADKGCAVPNR